MKRTIILSAVLCLALSTTAFAMVSPDYFWMAMEDGSTVFDQEGYEQALAWEEAAALELSLNLHAFESMDADGNFAFDYDAYENAREQELALRNQALTVSETENESVILEDEAISEVPLLDENQTVSDLLEDDPFADDSAEPSEISSYRVVDLRTASADEETTSSGLKTFVQSIFGTYTPVFTAQAVTETVDGENIITLIDAVAEGAAGVDYEWIAGVAIFCIVLLSFFRILGVVFKS